MFVRLRVMGLAGPVEVRPLQEETALETGADLLGEIVVFGFGVGIFTLEYIRTQRKEARREQKQTDQIGNLVNKVEVLTTKLNDLDQQMAEMKSTVQQTKTQTDASNTK